MSLSRINDLLAEPDIPSAALDTSGMTKINLKGLSIRPEYMESDDSPILYCSLGKLSSEVSPGMYEFFWKPIFSERIWAAVTGVCTPRPAR